MSVLETINCRQVEILIIHIGCSAAFDALWSYMAHKWWNCCNIISRSIHHVFGLRSFFLSSSVVSISNMLKRRRLTRCRIADVCDSDIFSPWAKSNHQMKIMSGAFGSRAYPFLKRLWKSILTTWFFLHQVMFKKLKSCYQFYMVFYCDHTKSWHSVLSMATSHLFNVAASSL